MPDSEDNPQSEIPLASKILESGHVDDQRGSPLFRILPPEIRNRIFAFACTAYETIPYTPNAWYYRPGYQAHRRISASLLLACRRIYLETYTLPLEVNEHVFWGGIGRGPPRRYSGIDNYKRTDVNAFFDCLTPQQRLSIQEVHLFAQQFWLEGLDLTSGRIATRKIKLTLRYQDWYFWEDDEPLGICPWLPGRVYEDDMERGKAMVPSLPRDIDRYMGWGRQLQFVHGLEELEIEFEMLRHLKDIKLDPVVAFAKQWQFPLMRQGVLEWDQSLEVKEYTWTGSKILRSELDEPMISFYEDDEDNPSEPNHEYQPDNVTDETGSTYDFSDWEDEAPSSPLHEDAVADIARHAYSPTALQFHGSRHDTEDRLDQPNPAREHRGQPRQPSATVDDQDIIGPVIYEPPQIVDAEDARGPDARLPGGSDPLASDGPDRQPAMPLLALESNVQDYYVISLTWRKRKQGSDLPTTS